jgi:hypothetical protein
MTADGRNAAYLGCKALGDSIAFFQGYRYPCTQESLFLGRTAPRGFAAACLGYYIYPHSYLMLDYFLDDKDYGLP